MQGNTKAGVEVGEAEGAMPGEIDSLAFGDEAILYTKLRRSKRVPTPPGARSVKILILRVF